MLQNNSLKKEKKIPSQLSLSADKRAPATLNIIPSIVVAFFIILIISGTKSAQAKEIPDPNKDYKALKIIQSYPSVNIKGGEAITFTVGFKNEGRVTWRQKGEEAVVLNTVEDSQKISPFRHKFWPTNKQPCWIEQKTVKPGEIGYFRFALQSPQKAGKYTAKFQLFQKNIPLEGGELEIPIIVTNANKPTTNNQQPTTNQQESYEAIKLIQSAKSLEMKPNETQSFTVGFKNVGTAVWEANSVALNVTNPTNRISPFKHSSWNTSYQPCKIEEQIQPGEIGYCKFFLIAPQSSGKYFERFNLIKGDHWIEGGHLEITIVVSSTKQPITTNQQPTTIQQEPILIQSPPIKEPSIRVGLYHTKETVNLTADKNYEVQSGEGQLLARISAYTLAKVTFDFETKKYTLETPGPTVESFSFLKFIPSLDAENIVFEILNYNNLPTWNLGLSDNKFRDSLEVRFAPQTEKFWVINELPMEKYLRGLAETSNNSSHEYQKALIITARTYAMYHWFHPTKHTKNNFLLTASAGDQVYRGYGAEVRLSQIAKAQEETSGMMITYNNEVVITPYFSQSDGRTRAWEEVWAGNSKPYLISKIDPYCQGLPLLGHGVGMSAKGALLMAENGINFQEILKYYYTGIKIKKMY